MDTDILQTIWRSIGFFIWPALAAVTATAGYLLFAAEKKHFHLMIGIGGTLHFFTGAFQAFLFSPIFSGANGSLSGDRIQEMMTMVSLIGTLSSGMVTYGIFCVAWVRFKNRHQEDSNAENF